MYQVKIFGKGQVFVYCYGFIESMKEQVILFIDLYCVICICLLDFYLQGKFSLMGKLIGVEFLCCWFLLLYGMVSFGMFIFLVEVYGFDGEIGLMVLELVCEYIVMMEVEGLSVFMLVNISVNQLFELGFVNIVLLICDEYVVVL